MFAKFEPGVDLGKPIEHAKTAAKILGGKPKDYLVISEILDATGKAFGDVRHRAGSHTKFFIEEYLPRMVGKTIKNSNGKRIPTVRVAEIHILEDFGGELVQLPDGKWTIEGGFIPSAQDFWAEIEPRDWMDNAKNSEVPPSRKKIKAQDDRKVPGNCPDCNNKSLERDHSGNVICQACGLVTEGPDLVDTVADSERGMPAFFDSPSGRCGGGGMGSRMVID